MSFTLFTFVLSKSIKVLVKSHQQMKNSKKNSKQQLAQWLVDANSDCGFNNYHGYKMSDDDFLKEQMKKSKSVLINDINNHSDDGQEFLTQNGIS